MTHFPRPVLRIGAACALLALPLSAEAGVTGKIAGRVFDAASGQPLIAVNVIVAGTTLGAATDDDGHFAILNLRPGLYRVTADRLGHQRVTMTDVRVSVDHTTRLRFDLMAETLQLEEGTVVTADREVFVRDLTASQATVDGARIQDLPANELNEILELQAGITTDAGGGLHFRGGRSGEVAFLVDGVSLTDAFGGGQALAVENASIQEVQVISGAFNAEYGQAMSGVVNVVTREGADHWSGNISSYAGDHVSSHDDLYWGIDQISPLATQNVQASISGPILADRLTLFANARAVGSEGHLLGRRTYNFFDTADFSSPDEEDWRSFPTGSSELTAMNPYRKYTGQAKLAWRASDRVNIRYNVTGEDSRSQGYDHFFRLNPDGRPLNTKSGLAHTLTATHTLGAAGQTFYDLGFSTFTTHDGSRVFEDPNDPRYFFTDYLSHTPDPYSFATGGVTGGWYERETRTSVAKAEITSQLTRQHLVKSGVEVRAHFFDFYDQQIFNGRTAEPQVTTHSAAPREMSAYIQDKVEIDDFVMNFGIRYDRFDPDGRVPFDPRDPDVNRPARPFFDTNEGRIVGFDDVSGGGENGAYTQGTPVFDGAEPDVAWDNPRAATLRDNHWFTDASPKVQISPRFGISYPISDRGGLHVSYGHFFQMPSLATLYTNPGWKLGAGTGISALMGNPGLRAQKTVQYELGLQQEIATGGRLTADLFYRDFRDLLASDRLVTTYDQRKYAQYDNRDHAHAKGIAIAISHSDDQIYWALDYTFQIANGLASDPAAAYRRALAEEDPRPQLVPLDWDRRHSLNIQLAWESSQAWGVSTLANFWSPTPYTPEITLIGAEVENGGRIPAYYNIDFYAHRTFQLGPVSAEVFLKVFNATDRKNELFVFADTGRATETLDELRAKNNATEYVNTVEDWFDDPSRFSAPRHVQLGTTWSF